MNEPLAPLRRPAVAPQPLDALTLPLQGSHLIEASAGTGKTWTIAALYLRLVLGHGAAQPLLPGEILVMTFTKAATRELARRIRERLVEAARCLRSECEPQRDDDFLRGLITHHAAQGDAPAAAWRLARAAEGMDDAAIHTIDAWCQRMLREHAFDSGCLFDEELQANEAAIFTEAAHDYWRQQVYPLEGEALAEVLALWPDVNALLKAVLGLLDKALPAEAGQGDLRACIVRHQTQRRAELGALKAGWAERAEQMRHWLELLWTRKDKPLDGRVLGQKRGNGWLDSLAAWAADPQSERPMKLGEGANKLTDAGVMSALKPGFAIRPLEQFAQFAQLMETLSRLPAADAALRACLAPHAAAHVVRRMQQLKAQAGTYGFADMLARLNDALDEAKRGKSAVRLRARILAQYPAALIDEFQDTSPVQLSIFDRLYRIESNAPDQALLLIGDPKQAIYGFRGADIQSYLSARRATAGRHHVLGINHRASTALVAAVNSCFEAAELRPGGEGALMFGKVGGTELPFMPVQAQGRKQRFVTAAGEGRPLVMCLDAELRGRTDSRELFAALCAERIVHLLNDASAGFEQAGEPMRRLRPADVAVLVRTGTEAAAMRLALRCRGVASVYLSDKDTVFAQPEAADLLRLLQAVAAPRDMRLARAAFATALAGASLPELALLADDEVAFDARCELLRQWHTAWQAQGVLAMLRGAVHGLQLPARWLAPAGTHEGLDGVRLEGERRLTNLLHMAELLQAQSMRLNGEQALIRWFAQEVDDAHAGRGATAMGGGGEEQVLRLESDADLVQVVTVHQSKGLEYPLVFLPFAADFRAVDARDGFVQLPDERGGRQLVLAPDAAQWAAADRERQREDLRLLYVAFTRACHALWVGVAALADNRGRRLWQRSALGYLVSGPDVGAAHAQVTDLRALAGAVPEIALRKPAWAKGAGDGGGDGESESENENENESVAESVAGRTGLPAVPLTHLRERAEPPPLGLARAYTGSFDRRWSISSYSALVKGVAGAAGAAASASLGGARQAAVQGPSAAHGAAPDDLEPRWLLDDEPAEVPDGGPAGEGAAASPADAPWHRFPRGAFAGHFLHGQLEWLADEGFAELDASPGVQQALRRRCERQGWGHRAGDVLAWLRVVCSTPLPALGASAGPAAGAGVALAGLERTLPEMEFWLPSDGLDVRAIDELCCRHILPGQPRPALPERALRGMLMGFADLVFEHQGRFGVLDYKSNALGTHDARYTEAAMQGAVLQHRYDVQAALYLLALHRLLKQRLRAAYAPAQHLHGAVFFFLRGVRSAGAGGLLVRPPLVLLEALEAMVQPAAATVLVAEGSA